MGVVADRTLRFSSTGGLHDDDAQAAARIAAKNGIHEADLCLPACLPACLSACPACPASLKADLDRYAALHAQAYGEAVDAVTLVPHMLEAFVAGD
ncbi:uncharacterized protein DUF2274 [Stenotrophomonas rhizophila]|uniref:Uncharacterized protein DUF2274 n=1 Tax=Stenotrophomonas rhizophila TaxID=216778 RepID=A0A498CIF3_9GAMM|nr:uncharacterized protein DUF2274 [Stenotrophomonas rhizophila]